MAVINNPDRAIRSSTGGSGPVSQLTQVPLRTFVNPLQFNAPNTSRWAYSGPFLAPRRTPNEGRQALHPLPQPAVGSDRFGTLLG
ncbi:hypothetical protein SAMN05444050_6842 [Afipia sp. GAS231]|nr:hypothetical protein SAMN05444050_6842 [Afipia sp. GAS231]